MTKQILFTTIFLLGGLGILSAQGTLTGTISSKLDGPLIGASLLIQGTSQGTVTDFDGNFELAYDSPDQILIISYTGYNTQEIAIGAAPPAEHSCSFVALRLFRMQGESTKGSHCID